MHATTHTRETLVPPPLLVETLVQMMSEGAVVIAVRFGKTMSTIIVERRARHSAGVEPAADRRQF